MDYSDIYIMNDQPTTCPICGSRTELILDLSDTVEKTQYHKCLAVNCSYKFIVEEDT
jgi:hypothetical protein